MSLMQVRSYEEALTLDIRYLPRPQNKQVRPIAIAALCHGSLSPSAGHLGATATGRKLKKKERKRETNVHTLFAFY